MIISTIKSITPRSKLNTDSLKYLFNIKFIHEPLLHAKMVLKFKRCYFRNSFLRYPHKSSLNALRLPPFMFWCLLLSEKDMLMNTHSNDVPCVILVGHVGALLLTMMTVKSNQKSRGGKADNALLALTMSLSDIFLCHAGEASSSSSTAFGKPH